jgi:hypothetical protein
VGDKKDILIDNFVFDFVAFNFAIQKIQFQKSVVVVPAKTWNPVFSALFWALTFAGVTLFNSFEIGSEIIHIYFFIITINMNSGFYSIQYFFIANETP